MENNATLIKESGISTTSILLMAVVCVVVVGGIIYYQQQKNKKIKGNLLKKDDIKPSNLNELSQKFKNDYFIFELSQFAKIERIDFEKVKEIYPKFKHSNDPASIDWTTFTGKDEELENILKNWDKYQNFTLSIRYMYFLKESYEDELNSIKKKIKDLK